MKKKLFIMLLFIGGAGTSLNASAQADELQQLTLNLEKLAQFKQILSDLKKGYEIVSVGYNTIKNISQGNFNLHKDFLHGLMQISPTVKNYKRVADIINYQIIIVKEYKRAFGRFKNDKNFNSQELEYLNRVYNNLFKQSLKNLEDLTTVVTANKLRMTDDERLKSIDDIFNEIQDKVMFLRNFNNNTTILAVQRAKERNDAETIRNIYGIKY
jgi:DNA repair ATPase RecN